MCRLNFLAVTLLLGNADCFSPVIRSSSKSTTTSTEFHMTPPGSEGPAGSFFHRVPGNNDGESDADDEPSSGMDKEINKLIKQRKSAPLASQPSTINGVPTSKVTGFGKPKENKKKNPSKPFIPIGPPDAPPVNDPTKPEFDDQGYTLYTDRKTGEKARVFEALVDYPCDFTMKIVGASESSFVTDMVGIVAEACEATPEKIPHSFRAMGKWTSVTVEAPVKSSEMLYALYEKLDLDPRVRFKF